MFLPCWGLKIWPDACLLGAPPLSKAPAWEHFANACLPLSAENIWTQPGGCLNPREWKNWSFPLCLQEVKFLKCMRELYMHFSKNTRFHKIQGAPLSSRASGGRYFGVSPLKRCLSGLMSFWDFERWPRRSWSDSLNMNSVRLLQPWSVRQLPTSHGWRKGWLKCPCFPVWHDDKLLHRCS